MSVIAVNIISIFSIVITFLIITFFIIGIPFFAIDAYSSYLRPTL